MTNTITLTLNRREAEILADVLRRAQNGDAKKIYDIPTLGERIVAIATAVSTLDLELEG